MRGWIGVWLLSSLVAVPVNAAVPRCQPHEKMVEWLLQAYKEAPQSIGIVNEERFLEVFSSKEGTFTILVTQPDGLACIVAAGQDWETKEDHLKVLEPEL